VASPRGLIINGTSDRGGAIEQRRVSRAIGVHAGGPGESGQHDAVLPQCPVDTEADRAPEKSLQTVGVTHDHPDRWSRGVSDPACLVRGPVGVGRRLHQSGRVSILSSMVKPDDLIAAAETIHQTVALESNRSSTWRRVLERGTTEAR